MIQSFADKTTEALYHGHWEAAVKIPNAVWKIALRKLDLLNAAQELKDLWSPPGNRLEKLKGSLAGRYSIRVNDQFRLVFRFEQGEAYEVFLTDYH